MLYYQMGKASKKKKLSSSDINKGKKPNPEPSNTASPGKSSYRPFVHLVMIAILGLLAYSNTFHVPFQWDGEDFILKNPAVKDLSYFTEPSRTEGLLDNAVKTRYMGYLTFALNYKFHGFDVVGYHIINLAIHLVNAILVYFLVLFTFRTPYFAGTGDSHQTTDHKKEGSHGGIAPAHSRFIALAVALLFVTHPVQTEAVTYIFQRLASLVAMFYLLSLVLYIKGRLGVRGQKSGAKAVGGSYLKPHTSYVFYSLSLISSVFAMKTKENAFTLPVMIALYEFFFFYGPLKSRILRLVPFMLTMLIVPLLFLESGFTAGEIISQVKAPGAIGYQSLSRLEYLFTQFRVIVTYIRLLIFPADQNLVYDYPVYRSFFNPEVILSFLFLSTLFGTAVYLIYKSRQTHTDSLKPSSLNDYGPTTMASCYRLISFGILWFFITLSVESSIVPIPMVIDEYRMYIPSVGFFIALVTAGFLIFERFLKPSLQQRKAAVAAFGAVVLLLASVTYARNTVWSDKISLWEDVVSKSPGSWKALNNLGKAYNEKKLHEKAVDVYERALSLNPAYPPLYSNLGAAYAGSGRRKLAVENFLKAIEMNPYDGAAHTNLARAYAEEGRIAEAANHYDKAARLNPFDSTAYHGLGTAYAILGRLDDALAAYGKFVELSPNNPEAFRSRGFIYAQKGDMISASADFKKACALGDKESCGYSNTYR